MNTKTIIVTSEGKAICIEEIAQIVEMLILNIIESAMSGTIFVSPDGDAFGLTMTEEPFVITLEGGEASVESGGSDQMLEMFEQSMFIPEITAEAQNAETETLEDRMQQLLEDLDRAQEDAEKSILAYAGMRSRLTDLINEAGGNEKALALANETIKDLFAIVNKYRTESKK